VLKTRSPIRTLIGKIRTLRGLPAFDRRLAVSTIALTALVRSALWILPFRFIKRGVESSGPLSRPRRRATASQVAWAVRVASRYVPRATCLTQALTARMLLNWSGVESTLRIGVRRNQKFEAHAWVECGGRILMGGDEKMIDSYSPMLTLERRVPGC
jgi:hypothetical protein